MRTISGMHKNFCGESTPFYLFHQEAPPRILFIPQAKLIVLLRDPWNGLCLSTSIPSGLSWKPFRWSRRWPRNPHGCSAVNLPSAGAQLREPKPISRAIGQISRAVPAGAAAGAAKRALLCDPRDLAKDRTLYWAVLLLSSDQAEIQYGPWRTQQWRKQSEQTCAINWSTQRMGFDSATDSAGTGPERNSSNTS